MAQKLSNEAVEAYMNNNRLFAEQISNFSTVYKEGVTQTQFGDPYQEQLHAAGEKLEGALNTCIDLVNNITTGTDELKQQLDLITNKTVDVSVNQADAAASKTLFNNVM